MNSMESGEVVEGDADKSFDENLERFQVYSKVEISRILRQLHLNKQLIRLSFSGSMESVITSILEVDTEKRELTVDRAPVEAQNRIALRAKQIGVEGLLDRIRISFSVNHVRQELFEGQPALILPFPDRMVRLQRREYFRVPISNCVVRIPVESDGKVSLSVGTVRDLSTTGACVVDASLLVDNTVGRVYENCRLELADTQPITVSLQVRNSHEFSAKGSSVQRRIGCQFVNLSQGEQALIQRYIARLERQRRVLTG